MTTAFRRVYPFFLALVSAWCILIVATPLLKSASVPSEVTDAFYRFFSRICHQFDDRSFHLSGEKLAVCIRCSSIYFSFLTALLFYPFLNRWHRGRVPPLFVLFAACAPMVIDVTLNLSTFSLSTLWSRMLSGALFGGILPFYIFPPLAEAVPEISLRKGVPNAGKAK